MYVRQRVTKYYNVLQRTPNVLQRGGSVLRSASQDTVRRKFAGSSPEVCRDRPGGGQGTRGGVAADAAKDGRSLTCSGQGGGRPSDIRTTTYDKVLQRTTPHHKRTTTYFNVLQRTTTYYNVLQCTTTYYNVLQCTTTYYNVLPGAKTQSES